MASGTRRWILVTDDDPETARVVKQEAGTTWVVAVATDLEQALDIVRNNDVAVMLSRPNRPTWVDAVHTASRHTVVILVGGDDSGSLCGMTPIAGGLPRPLGSSTLRAALAQGVARFENVVMEEALGIESRRLERIYALRSVTAVLTHDIKNTIGVVAGNVELGRWRIDDLKAILGSGRLQRQEANEAISEIETCLSEILGGVDDLLTSLRVFEEESKPLIQKSQCDFGRVVRLVLQSMSATRDLDLTGETNRPMWVRGQWTQVGQLVQCLLMSAATMWRSGVPTSAHLVADGDFVRLELNGHGPTFSENALAQLLDPLLQAKTDGGRGLGLPIAWRIAKDLGGQILLENQLEGTRVVLRIPNVPAAGE